MTAQNKFFLEVINQLRIKSYSVLKQNKDDTYFVVRGTIENQQVLIKMVAKEDQKRFFKIKKEKIFSDLITETNKLKIGKVIGSDEQGNWFWIIRKFIPGDSLSSYNSGPDPLMGYDHVKIKYRNHSKKIVEEIIASIKELQRIKKFSKESESWSKRFTLDVILTLKIIEKKYAINLESQKEFYRKNIEGYKGGKNQRLTISDFVPSNIIISVSGDVYLSDFEWACVDNYTLDISHLWLFWWRLSDWQNHLIRLFVKTDADKINFRISIIRLLTIFLHSSKNEEISFYKNHIWLRYLIAAGESFEAIMDVK